MRFGTCASLHGPAAKPYSMAAGSLPHPNPLQALRQMGVEGVLVLDVPPGTPAAKAGMQVGARGEKRRASAKCWPYSHFGCCQPNQARGAAVH